MASTEDIIDRLKKELEEARKELDEVTDETTQPPDAALGGGTSGYSTWQTAVVLKQHVEKKIEDLEDALDRAEKGLYGKCESCGENIPPERLEALPFTTLCVSCASNSR